MTGTLISLISISIGILGANLMGYLKKEYSFGFTGNTLVGVFGSIFLIKTFGRLGFDPWAIMYADGFNGFRLLVNLLLSALGGALGLIVVKMMYNKLNA
ncbi:hypothetical protein BN863_24590 [Formosa agariphila KMM 3901]|uniref:Uncharacterized protein n=1 Tax=Formosa agariphila (strain DSM 15362 / KCTC 12365 / LMG 23005 / KMM 3901 / M-2Alg 35-1) TaxID=1347342 RepID=T2KNZ2_FORAG|nr:hypothetical protein [Formosa agariphila]CDF80171.1 hypothetical protein BN863_24590 [Formosa agariphila KMM 3901]